MRHLQLCSLASNDRPVLRQNELKCFARRERSSQSPAARSAKRRSTCKRTLHWIVLTFITKARQFGVELLQGPQPLRRCGELR